MASEAPERSLTPAAAAPSDSDGRGLAAVEAGAGTLPGGACGPGHYSAGATT
jgi:hypothetical protein